MTDLEESFAPLAVGDECGETLRIASRVWRVYSSAGLLCSTLCMSMACSGRNRFAPPKPCFCTQRPRPRHGAEDMSDSLILWSAVDGCSISPIG